MKTLKSHEFSFLEDVFVSSSNFLSLLQYNYIKYYLYDKYINFTFLYQTTRQHSTYVR